MLSGFDTALCMWYWFVRVMKTRYCDGLAGSVDQKRGMNGDVD